MTRQGLAKVQAKNEFGNHILYSWKVQESGREWTPHSQMNPHFGKLEPQWTPKSLKGDYKDQKSLDWNIPYIIGKLLERRYLKWASITHLDT